MLFHITQTHSPEHCPKGAGGCNSLFDATYSMSKIAQEAVARSCARAYDLPVVIARMNVQGGDRQHDVLNPVRLERGIGEGEDSALTDAQ